ncbi:phage antirepressor [Cytobacillus sp. FSL W8-0315]|uniref:phage antirepressor n=1 Tax=Cytobacillus sp. FSL W8-0315 TaxID=2921600 RepID=UPI0030F5040A
MNELTKVFQYGANVLRTVVKDGEPWFVAKDVCEVLEIKNNRDALSRLDEDEKGVDLIDTLGGRQEVTIINEPGLYSLILGSRKSEAKKFKRWITHEVIPTIRKHGAYMTDEVLEKTVNDPDFMIGLLTNLKVEKQKRIAAEQTIVEQRPKVVFAEAVEVSKNSILVKDLATLLKQKGIDIGQNRLFEWLRNNGYLCKKLGAMYNKPTQKSLDKGLFELKPYVRSGSNGEMKTEFTPKVTGKGQIYFVNKFMKELQLTTEVI